MHNLEHGYTILWYDETVADDDDTMNELRGIAKKFDGTTNLRVKFKAVPWTSDDGDAFPDGQHVALHALVGRRRRRGHQGGKQVGVWQYCSAPSGDALEELHAEVPLHGLPRAGSDVVERAGLRSGRRGRPP